MFTVNVLVFRQSSHERVIKDLSVFFFETPFCFKNDRNTLLVEPHSDKRRNVDSEEDESQSDEKDRKSSLKEEDFMEKESA